MGSEWKGGVCVLRLTDPVSVFLDWVGEGEGEVRWRGREVRGREGCVCVLRLTDPVSVFLDWVGGGGGGEVEGREVRGREGCVCAKTG